MTFPFTLRSAPDGAGFGVDKDAGCYKHLAPNRARKSIRPAAHRAAKPQERFRESCGESMSLKDQIISDMTAAMKAKDATRTSTLRLVKAAIVNREKDKGAQLDDEEVTKLLRSQVKQRRDSVEHYQKGGRPELVEKETAEIAVIESYLPQAASAEEIEGAVADAIAETGAASIKDMGAVMKAVMLRLAGKNAEGRTVSETVKQKLAG